MCLVWGGLSVIVDCVAYTARQRHRSNSGQELCYSVLFFFNHKMFWWNWAADQAGTQLNCPVLLPDLSSPEAPVSRGAPAGPVPKPAHHVRIPALPATHSEFGGADPTLWGNRLQNCAAGGHLHREVQRQKARGQQDPVRAVGARYDVPFCNVILNAQIICHVINTLSLPLFCDCCFR